MNANSFITELREKVLEYPGLHRELSSCLDTLETSLALIETSLTAIKVQYPILADIVANLESGDYSPANLGQLTRGVGNDYAGSAKGHAQQAEKIISGIYDILLCMEDLKIRQKHAHAVINFYHSKGS